ncbi:MAG: MotA/TolQ/ExbB proton channel family protein [Kiritimatiellae bacterium]|nr:MotA/TolQ/ExbB proton channel family protein [Kiritimatiellia bacterium]
MKRSFLATLALAGLFAFAPAPASAQEEAPDSPAAESAAAGQIEDSSDKNSGSSGQSTFYTVLFGSGWLGTVLWLALFGALGYFIYLAIDCGILVRASKIMPQSLISNVQAAMKEGDVVKALQFCENEPTPMANILSAGFIHVEEGFDIIQEAVSAAADLETERIMQRLAWISVCANIAPQLGLLGTVQGMIMAFGNLGSGGTPDVGLLATNISQALYTTAGGLTTSIPAVCFFYYYRNKANQIILRMEATTMELIKDLRNVEVVS